MQNKKERYISQLKKQIIVFDGPMGTSLQQHGLTPKHFGGEKYNGCNDILSITYPEAILKVHHSFLDVGVDLIETNTFRSNRITLAEFGLSDQTDAINKAGAKIAREAVHAHASEDRILFVAGAMGPTGILLSLPSKGNGERTAPFDEIRTVYSEQAQSLIEGGVDLMLIETAQDILEVKAAILGVQDAFKRTSIELPIQVQVTLDINGHMLLGTDIDAVVTILEGMDIDVIGVNCSTGPEHMEEAVKYLSEHSRLPIACLPNAGLPINENGMAIYPLSAEDFTTQMMAFIEKYDLSVVGGCCGNTPRHLKMLVDHVGKRAPTPSTAQTLPSLSSAFHSIPMRQKPAPFLIGERLNTQGSRKFKQMMLENDMDGAVRLGKQQVAGGAHALDICTALTEDANEIKRTSTLVSLLAQQVDIPLVIDSTNVDVMRAALEHAPGRCLLNSVNLENGEAKARQVFQLAKQFNAAMIALTIDERGMADSAERKLEIAQRIAHIAVKDCGLETSALVFDPLTFTLASGSAETNDAAVQTLEGIRLIKKRLPEAHVVLGVSNISFGLSPTARKPLNSVFLFHAVKAGLDMAILNPLQMTPYASLTDTIRSLAEDLVFNRNPNSLKNYIEAFAETPSDMDEEPAADLEDLPIEEKIRRHITTREANHLAENIETYIHSDNPKQAQEKALEILNSILLPAMGEIGEQFATGELILPFVLQSAEIMRAATKILDQYLEKADDHSRGTLVLATVYGDVHDIGKNLIHTIISNNGYEVIDLGKQVPAEMIIEKALECHADAIGLSALLVSTSQQMPLIVNMLHARGAEIPVLIGGAAVNAPLAKRIRSTDNGDLYKGDVHYCKDAFDALKILESVNTRPQNHDLPTIKNEREEDQKPDIPTSHPSRNSWQPTKIPKAPFWGAKIIPLPLEALFERVNRPALYRIGWGVGKASGEKWVQYQKDFDVRFERMRAELLRHAWLNPKAAYGYFSCVSEGNRIKVQANTTDPLSEAFYLDLPRQDSTPYLCLSDYFAPNTHSEKDVAVFQLVSMGNEATAYVHDLQEQGNLVEAYFAHGLAVQLTEAAAEFMHEQIRNELHLDKKRGKRYSWGYAPIPDLSQHEAVVRILKARETLGINLTSAFQFIPEYSTAALVVHHPDAKYFQIEVKGKA
jgi:5-methyltetrahydrofolate--homocysteine methyltransferase